MMKNPKFRDRILRFLPLTIILAGFPFLAAQAQDQAGASAQPKIGGEAPVTLHRAATKGAARPEFLSLTFLPGLGMNVFQITAEIPGKGEISVLTSPSLEELADRLDHAGPRIAGMNASFGSAFLIPYPNRIFGERSADGTTVTTEWHGHKLVLPALPRFRNAPASASASSLGVAMHGLIFQDHAQDVHIEKTADGQTATAVIHAGSFGGHWLSETDLHFSFSLSGNAIVEKITATNIGHEDEPIAIGAHPYFSIPSQDRAQARVHIPARMRALVASPHEELPTGELQPVAGTAYDFQAPEGVALDDRALDDNFSHLEWTNGAVDVKLIDPEFHYGIEVEGVSPTIKTVQVYSPKGRNFLAVEDQFNFIDPFGKEWKGMNTGMVTLHPGQSTTWEVRLHLFTPRAGSM